MIKKLIATCFLFSLVGFALWQAFLPKEAATKGTNLDEYVNASIGAEEIPVSGIEQGNEAPDFSLSTLAGETLGPGELKGKKIIVNFWATWCPPCKEEMPEMQKFHEAYGDKVTILAVNLTSREIGKKSVQTFIQEHAFTFPVLLDEKDVVGTKKYKILTIPTSYFIDERGMIVQRIDGPMSFKQMEEFALNK